MWRPKLKLQKAGRPPRPGARSPNGQIRQRRAPDVGPTPELTARRVALFGSAATQAEVGWLIDRMWGLKMLDDREREAARRFNALHRGALARCGAPRLSLMAFHDAGSASPAAPQADAPAQEAEHRAALDVLGHLGSDVPVLVMGAVCYERLDQARVAVVRVGLAALAAHFSHPQERRLARVLRLDGGLDSSREAADTGDVP